MKSVLISIRPKWCEKICHVIGKDEAGKSIYEKRIEVRKTAPKCEVPFKCYIYCTYGQENENYMLGKRGKAIGEFICDKVEVLFNTNGNPENYMTDILPTVLQKTALSFKEFQNYVGSRSDKNNIYGWHISDLKIYDEPKELSEFKTGCKGCKERDTYHCKFYCYGERPITRPPQSWQYVEEL